MAKDPKTEWQDAHAYATRNFGGFEFVRTDLDGGKVFPAFSGTMYYDAVTAGGVRMLTQATVKYPNGATHWQPKVPRHITNVQVVR